MKKLLFIAVIFTFGLTNASPEIVKENEAIVYAQDNYQADEIVYELKNEILTVYSKESNGDLKYVVSLSLKDYTYSKNKDFKKLSFDLFEIDGKNMIARTALNDSLFAYCFSIEENFSKGYSKKIANEASGKLINIKIRKNRHII